MTGECHPETVAARPARRSSPAELALSRLESAPAPSSASYRLDRLRVRHLRMLEVIHRRGSLGAAAKEMALSQPAVTLMLRELELVFGGCLVERDVRGGRLTAVGLHALERLQVALASLDRALEAAQPQGLAPPLMLGCSQVAGVHVLPRALSWLQAHDGVPRMQMVEGEAMALMEDLVDGRLDSVIVWMDETLAARFPMALFDVTPLWRGRMQVVASTEHPLAGVRDVSMDALQAASWVLPRPASRTAAAFLKLFVQHGLAPPAVTVECASIHTGMNMVSATSMLTVTPDTVARHYALQGMVAILQGQAIALGDTHASLVCLKEHCALSPLVRLRTALLATALPPAAGRRATSRTRPAGKPETAKGGRGADHPKS